LCVGPSFSDVALQGVLQEIGVKIGVELRVTSALRETFLSLGLGIKSRIASARIPSLKF